MNRDRVCNWALSEVDTWMSFHMEKLLHFLLTVCHDSTIKTIRVDQRRTFLVVKIHLEFSG